MSDTKNIRERLYELRQPNWSAELARRATALPGARRTALRKILEPAEKQRNWFGRGNEFVVRIDRFLQTLDDDGRLALWRDLFPKLAPYLERMWQDAGSYPYQHGFGRTGFRAPHRAEALNEIRARQFYSVCFALGGFDVDIEWVAAWAAHIPETYLFHHVVGALLGAALRGGGRDAEAVRSILIDSINGEHEIGQMSQDAVAALLMSDRREDWEFVGKLLLAAQRQEGLRQTILETIDEAHTESFRYMLGVILENDLGRFSAAVRAFDVWLGLNWAGGSVKVVHNGVRRIAELLDDKNERVRAIQCGEAEDAYMALWTAALEDADAALKLAAPLLNDESAERRYVALVSIARIGFIPDALDLIGSRFISGQEDDRRLQMAMIRVFAQIHDESVSADLFNAVGRLYERVPEKPTRLEPIVWPWAEYKYERSAVAQALAAMAQGSPEKLIPFASALPSHECVRVVQELAGLGVHWIDEKRVERKRRKLTSAGRQLMLELMGDARRDVQEVAFEAMKPLPVKEDEIERLTSLLHRKSPTLRSGAIERLSKVGGQSTLSMFESLLSSKNTKKRAAGVELVEAKADSKRMGVKVRSLLAKHRPSFSEPEVIEAADRLICGNVSSFSFDDCLGLSPADRRTQLPKPKFVGVHVETPASKELLRSLADLFIEHGETEIELRDEGSVKHKLLASAGWHFPSPRKNVDPRLDAKERLPLADIWLKWYDQRSPSTRDRDGLECLRAWILVQFGDDCHLSLLPKPFRPHLAFDLRFGFECLLDWIVVQGISNGQDAFLVQYLEDALARDAPSPLEKKELSSERAYRNGRPLADERANVVNEFLNKFPLHFSDSCKVRLAVLMMAIMELEPEHSAPSLDLFAAAYDAGALNSYDLIRVILNRTESEFGDRVHVHYGPIREVTRMRGAPELSGRPELTKAVIRVRERLVELELNRGERITVASGAAQELTYSGGADVLLKLLVALGRDKLVRQFEWGEPTRGSSLSHLIAVSSPSEADSPEGVRKLFDASGVPVARLIEVAMFAPQWACHIESVVGMNGFEEAVWWFHAHTKQAKYWRDQEVREMWAARISERTELESEDLEEGAVDVAWFRRVIDVIGADHWEKLKKPARYASNSGGHKRAELFADAMLGHVSAEALLERIDNRRHQDSVRALGLVPLPKRVAAAKSETLRRYKRLQEFKRESRKFGSQRQASEGRAVEIGMQNLARTAGYRDPRRLQWAMEAEAVTDLAKGPVTVTVEETSVTLTIDDGGKPTLSVLKKDRPLKSVPAKLRKHKDVSELRSRVTDLRRQNSRMRLSLEEAMCRGDAFNRQELREFYLHPMLRPMVQRLVFVGSGDLIGYPEADGRVLRRFDDSVEPIGKKDELRIAHAVDFLTREDWSAWQRECFASERVQPFKQVFREVYPKTASESDRCDFSRRYAGHQVNPRQALALLKTRQWVAAPEEGVRKTFHDAGLIAEVWFQEHFLTPADVDGLTLEGVAFVKRGKGEHPRIQLSEVPDRLFSEAMRDLDLAVSVAHAGGVDPEASASTVEMRATLLRETCQVLKLRNVRVEGHHALIEGSLGKYSVHLGSATTQVMPGKMLIIVAVHSQYRGRLFLPFADDDPRTAEVLAKTLLLARDNEIKDPSILSQIRS